MLANSEVEIAPRIHALPGLPAARIQDYIIVADLHLGYEEALSRDGVYLPRVQLRNAIKTLREIANTSPSTRKLVIAGDIKHAFNKLLRSEREEVSTFIREALTLYKEVIVIRGNHDNFISPIIKSEGAEFIEDGIEVHGINVIHGHKKPKDTSGVTVLGHEHPSIQVRVGGSRVKFPVFLRVPLDSGGMAVIIPAMGTYQTGNIISSVREAYLSPLIREQGLVDLAVPYIVDDSGGIMELARLEILEQILG